MRDVHADFPNTAYTTVMTTLDRLHRKGVLDRVKAGRAFLYRPRYTADELRLGLAADALGAISTRPWRRGPSSRSSSTPSAAVTRPCSTNSNDSSRRSGASRKRSASRKRRRAVSYLALGLSLALTAFLAVNLAVSLLVMLVWRVAERDRDGVRSESRAGGLFLLRSCPQPPASSSSLASFCRPSTPTNPRSRAKMVEDRRCSRLAIVAAESDRRRPVARLARFAGDATAAPGMDEERPADRPAGQPRSGLQHPRRTTRWCRWWVSSGRGCSSASRCSPGARRLKCRQWWATSRPPRLG